MFLSLLWTLACAPAPPIAEGGGGGVEGATLHRSSAGDATAWVVRGATGTELWVQRGDERWLHTSEGAPDRLALSDDGRQLAWVASLDGLPALFTSPAEPGARPVPLTNVGLQRRKGQAPDGFVPPPVHEGDLRFDGDDLHWDSPAGAQRVRWRQP